MRSKAQKLALAVTLTSVTLTMAGSGNAAPSRPQGPCDIYDTAGKACVAAHSTTRALYASYNGPLYQVLRQSDGKTLDIGVVQPTSSPAQDGGGYANAAAQDAFCAHTYCWITIIYDQSPKHNNLIQPPRGAFSGPSMGGFNNLPIADMAPVTVMGHKVYGVFIAPGMGLRQNDTKGTAVDDQAEGQYWVISGHHYNSGCCFDYGNAEIDSRDDDNGTMETTYYGNATAWYHGNPPGPWIMTDQENNLVGCVNPDRSKLCPNLSNIRWRFVTAIAKGEPHHWTSMGGDAQKGQLKVVFDGPRIDSTYDPMRKQGAILLGNGGDNSVASQGTFYEGAMTAAGTFPSDATDQLVQANVVAAKYDILGLSLTPATALSTPPGLQTFSPGSSQDTTLSFTNTTGAAVTGVKLNISVPSEVWKSVVSGTSDTAKTFSGTVAPGASVSATFTVTSGPAAFNGDLTGKVSWTNSGGRTESETVAEKVRNVNPVKLNEFRLTAGSADNSTDSFIELYNAGTNSVDISHWILTEHPTEQAIFSSVNIPAGTKLAAGGFYLLGLSNSGLAVGVRAGESTIYVRNTTNMSVGDTITVDTGAGVETRKITKLGTAAGNSTTVWQPLPDGPVVTIPAGSINVPVTSISGFNAGEKLAIGHGATYPTVGRAVEQFEVVTVKNVGKPGTQAFLGMDATAGVANIKVTSVANISVGDRIRLDIDSLGHGIETVTVTHVGTPAIRTNLTADASAGATSIKVRSANGFVVGDKLTIGSPANRETVTVSAIGLPSPTGAALDFTPVLLRAHTSRELAVTSGTGLDLAAPLRFDHAANLPFSARGTGISFTPETAFAHSSNEPVQPLGTGIILDHPLSKDHSINAVVRDRLVKNAGYQGTPEPNQWFGGPVLSTNSVTPAGLPISVSNGSIVLRDAAGMVVDSLNYGVLVEPWAAEGYQAKSGTGQNGCLVPSPATAGSFPPTSSPVAARNRSAGRFPDGLDTDSNCTDFRVQPATTLPSGSLGGANNIKVASVTDFSVGETVRIDMDENSESAVIQTIGTAGASRLGNSIPAATTIIPVANVSGFETGQEITIDNGESQETTVVASASRSRAGSSITVAAPLKYAHPAGTQISGSGITLKAALSRAHRPGTPVTTETPTPGAPNQYHAKGR